MGAATQGLGGGGGEMVIRCMPWISASNLVKSLVHEFGHIVHELDGALHHSGGSMIDDFIKRLESGGAGLLKTMHLQGSGLTSATCIETLWTVRYRSLMSVHYPVGAKPSTKLHTKHESFGESTKGCGLWGQWSG